MPRAVGVDLGGTKILAGLLGNDGRVLKRYEAATPLGSQEELLAALDASVVAVAGEGADAIGFGVPSTFEDGRVVGSVNVPLADLDLRARMQGRFGLPVGADNDANAAALAEWRFGAGAGSRYLVMLTLGTGVGGGIVLDGHLYRGAVGAAGELGHMVVLHDGPPCQGTCTGLGHLEALCSGHAADAAAREALGDDADSHLLVARAREGDERAREALATIGGYLGSALGTIVNVFDPEVIVIGGGFGTGAGELLLAPAREVLTREALQPGRDRVRVVPAELGGDAGLIGAALLGLEALDSTGDAGRISPRSRE